MERNRANFGKWLRSLPDCQFVEVIAALLAERTGPEEEPGRTESRLALVHAARRREADGWGDWTVQLVCPSPGWGADGLLCQNGRHCGFETVSCGKQSACPLCGGPVYGT